MVTKKIYTDLDVDGQIKANSIIFNQNAVDVTRELGETYWDPSTQSLITHQNNKHLNHGEELWVPLCYNNSGGDILNGQPVYINSSTGGYPTIELASSTTYEKSRLIGVATEDISNGQTGRITRFGYINDLDLTGLTSGSEVYLGHFALTGIRPTGGNYPVTVGKVIVGGHPGKLLVYPQSVQYTAEINNVTGFPSNLNGDNTTISFSDATRTLTINPTGSSYHYYISGVKYIKTSDSIQITDDEGYHVIYYNGATLTEAINPTKDQVYNIFSAYAPVTVISWDSTNNTAKFASDDRHTISWPSTLVAHDHTVFGTLYIGDYNPTGVVIGNGSLESHAQFGVDAGSILNEDIFTSSSVVGSTVGLPIFYRSGPSGSFVWRKTTRLGFSFLNDGTTGLMQYNLLTGGNWTLASATNNYITLVHVFALNNLISENVVALMGTKEYSSLSSAETGIGTEITEIMNNIKTYVVPIRHLYSFIYETKSSFANTVKARIIQTSTSKDFLDFRTSAVSIAVGGGGTGSSTFVGLSDVPDSYISHQNKLVKVNASETGVEFSVATIDTSNNFNTPGTITGTQLISTTAGGTSPFTVTSNTVVTNLNADLLDGQHGSYYTDIASRLGYTPYNASNPNGYTSNLGTVTEIVAGTGLFGGTITTTGTLSVSYGTTAGTACAGNDARLSDSRPASDVYAWAKAETKPSYSYSEVGAEQAFSKNTAFNKSFGNSSGTVCEGNDARLSDARTPSDSSVSYVKVDSTLKQKNTVTGTVDLSANGIGEITLSANTAFTFSNFELNKTYLLKITANGYTPSWAAAAKHVAVEGNASFGTSGVFYVSLTCIDATAGSEKLLTLIMKGV